MIVKLQSKTSSFTSVTEEPHQNVPEGSQSQTGSFVHQEDTFNGRRPLIKDDFFKEDNLC